MSVLGQTVEVTVGTWTRQDFPVGTPGNPFPIPSDVAGQALDINTALPLKGVTVTVTVGDKKYTGTTNDEGQYIVRGVPNGDATITMSLDGYKFASQKVLINGPTAANGFLKILNTIDLQGTIKGSRLGEVKPLENINIGLTGFAQPASSPESIHFLGPEVVWTDKGGSFTFDDLPPGRYVLEIVTEGYEYWSKEIVYRVGDNVPAPLEIVLTPLSAELSVNLKSSAYGNSPVKGAKVKLTGQPDSPVADIVQEKVTDKAGMVSWVDVPPGVYRLEAGPYPGASTDGQPPLFNGQQQWITLEEKADVNLPWDLRPALAEITVGLFTASVTDVDVRHSPLRNPLVPGRATRPCTAGSPAVTLHPTAGNFNALCVDPALPQVTQPPAVPGVIFSGIYPMESLRAPLPPGTRVRLVAGQHPEWGAVNGKAVRILGAEAAKEGALSSDSPAEIKPDADGMFSGLLPAGDYKLEIEGPDFERQTLDLKVAPGRQNIQKIVPTKWGTLVGHALHILLPTIDEWKRNGNTVPSPLREASAKLMAGDKEVAAATTDLQGAFVFPKVPAGAYTLKIEHELAKETYPVQVIGGGATNIVSRVVSAAKGGSLSARVYYDEKENPPCVPSRGTACIETVRVPLEVQSPRATLLDKDSASSVSVTALGSKEKTSTLSLPPGNYQGYLHLDLCGARSFAVAGSANLEASAFIRDIAKREVDCVLPVPSILQYAGYAVDTRGRPIPGAAILVEAQFRLEAISGRPASVITKAGKAETNDKGYFLVSLPYSLPSYSLGTVNTKVLAAGYKAASVANPQPATDFVLEPDTTLRLTVVEKTDGAEVPRGCTAEVKVDGIPAECAGTVYLRSATAGTTVTVRSALRGLYDVKENVTIPGEATGRIIDHKIVMEPIQLPVVGEVGGDDWFLLSLADKKPLMGRILAGVPHARKEGLQPTAQYGAPRVSEPLTHVRWQVRVDRIKEKLREGFRDPVTAVDLVATGRECGKEEDASPRSARFKGAPLEGKPHDDHNSGIWGGSFLRGR